MKEEEEDNEGLQEGHNQDEMNHCNKEETEERLEKFNKRKVESLLS